MAGIVWEALREGDRLTAGGGLTRTGAALLGYAERAGARLLVIDPTGIALALPEIDRAAVSLALGDLRQWAQRTGIAVLLVGHPAKAAEGEAADYSGSTAWLGSVRTLLTLRTPGAKVVDHECERWQTLKGRTRHERVALLARRKNNYGPTDDEPRTDALTVATQGAAAGWYLTDVIPPPPSRRAPAEEPEGPSVPARPRRTDNPY
ncbi:MAG: AAA family ATPase [Spirochaetaceae bacterium]|nr:AAA family ATPase [Spirochaetaceae bacterium]